MYLRSLFICLAATHIGNAATTTTTVTGIVEVLIVLVHGFTIYS